LTVFTACDSNGGMDDGDDNQSPTATLTVSPSSPVQTGTEVVLDASGSSDADGDAISFSWSLSAPSGSNASLSATSGADVRFTPDIAGDYGITVTVDDGNGGTDSADATITAEQPSTVEVNQDISTNTTWTADVTYRVTRTVEITNSSTLTIEPGTRVEFQADAGLRVDGNGSALVADGTSSDGILMTGTQQNDGFWEGVTFYSNNANNVLNYVTVEYGGSQRSSFIDSNGAVSLNNGAAVEITNTSITNSGDYGIALDDGAELPNFGANTLTSNAGAPMNIPGTQLGAPDAGSSYTGNTNDYVSVYGRDIVDDVTVTAIDVPYRVFGRQTITGTATFTVSAGTTMEFNADASIYVSGNNAALVVSGVSSDVVTLTGVNAAPGSWDGIGIASNNPSNAITHAIIEYGGGARLSFIDRTAALALNDGAEIEVSNTTIRNSDAFGIHLDTSARLPGFASNTFENNADAPVNLPAFAMADLDARSTFSNNPSPYVQVYDQDIVNDVTIQALDVPYRVFGSPIVAGNAFVTVNAGVAMEFAANASFSAGSDGALAFEGAQGNRITLTGTQTPTDGGFWNGIGFYSSDTRNRMVYTDVEYGGAARLSFIDNPANVAVQNGARLTIENSALNYSGNYGGYADDGTSANVTFSNNTYTGNDGPNTNWQ
jgi:hypothetical protein